MKNRDAKIKVCGMTSLEDTLVAVEAGADAVGFIFYKKSPRSVTIKTVCEIVDELPPFVDAIGIFVNESVEQINKILRVSRRLVQEKGVEPTPDDIAKELDMTVNDVKESLKNSGRHVSMDAPLVEGEDSNLYLSLIHI